MNRLLVQVVLVGCGLCLLTPARGQDVPPPVAPFIHPLPTKATWKIVINTRTNPRIPPAKANAWERQSLRIQKEIKKTKDGNTLRLETTWDDGATSDEWAYSDFILISYPGIPEVQVYPRHDGPMADMLGVGDFPEFGWLKVSDYKGTENRDGKLCYLFEQNANKSVAGPEQPTPGPARTASAGLKPVKVWIEVSTKLPVGSDDGVFAKTYTVSVDPPAALNLPPAFQDALQKRLKVGPDAPARPPMKL